MIQAIFWFLVMAACTIANIFVAKDPPSRGYAIASGVLIVVCALMAVFWGAQIISLL